MIQPRRRQRETFLPWVQLFLDAAVIYLLLQTVFWWRFQSGAFSALLASEDYDVYFKTFHLIVLVTIFFLRFYGLYRPNVRLTFADETWRVMKAVVAGTLVLMAITFFIRAFSFSRTFLVMSGLVLAPGISLARFLLGLLLMSMDHSRGSLRNVLIIGADANAGKLIQFYRKNPRFATKVTGVLDDKRSKGADAYGVLVLGKVSDLPELLKKEHQVHEVVLSDPGIQGDAVLKILYECEKEMVAFRWIADIFGLITSKMSISYLGGVSILSFMDSPLSDWENRILKRSTDILLSFLGLFFLSPALLLIAYLIRRDSPGPVFFKQERVGQDGRNFMLYKFRTMRVDAEAKTGPVWARENDDRRTRLGGSLRSRNLDELPQLWNVLKGEMSLVGPRPERPFFASQFKEDIPRYMARHSIRSGLSGWAQVNGLRGNTSIEERTKYDLYYIENWSLLLDLKILFMTFLARRNAY